MKTGPNVKGTFFILIMPVATPGLSRDRKFHVHPEFIILVNRRER